MKRSTGLLIMVLVLLAAACGGGNSSKSGKGTFIDPRDKQVYQWVRIGDQVWMSENLAYLPSISLPGEISYGPHYYAYGFMGDQLIDAAVDVNYGTYGTLYSWEAAKTACPKGWRLPTDDDWKILEMHLGMTAQDADKDYTWRQSGSVGKDIKAAKGWETNGNGTDSTGFAALPGGYRNDAGVFEYLGSYAFFWSASEGGALGAWSRALINSNSGVFRCSDNRRYGFSVRCIRE
jgi:uncharacterized protein (TIGR02145 family)